KNTVRKNRMTGIAATRIAISLIMQFGSLKRPSSACGPSFRAQRRVEDLGGAGPLEIAAETEFDLRSVERRRGQVAAERIDIKDGKGVAGRLDHVVEALAKTFQRREFVDPLDA